MMVQHVMLAELDGAAIGIAAGALVVGVVIGFLLVRFLGGLTIGRAQSEAARLRDQAAAEGRNAVEKAKVDSERQLLEDKKRAEEEIEKVRGEVREEEKRLGKRQDMIDRKEESLSQKEQALTRNTEALKAREERSIQREAEAERLVQQQTEQLHRVAGLDRATATDILLKRLEDETRHESGKLVREIMEEAESQAKEKAREITLMAVQRYAADHTSESTVSTMLSQRNMVRCEGSIASTMPA